MIVNSLRDSPDPTHRHRASTSGRPTIGFLVQASTGPSGFQDLVWKGVIEAAKERDVNAIILSGGWIGSVPDDPYNQSRNIVYDLVSQERIDGLAIDWSIGSYLTPAGFSAFCSHFAPLPIVTVFGKVEGYPHIRADNKTGLRNVITHLAHDHHYDRIAFIKGWEGHTDAEDRYAVYVETLRQCGIGFDPEMVYHGDFLEPSGRQAVEYFLMERKKNIQAIVASNDAMALGAVAALRERGMNVPEDIAVTGFDDSERAATCFPPLTTVRQRFDDLCRASIDVLLERLAGRGGPDSVAVPVELVVRESCGCSSVSVVQAGRAEQARLPEGSVKTPEGRRSLVEAMAADALAASLAPDRETLERMARALIEDAEHTRPDALLSDLRKTIYERVQGGRDVFSLVQIISLLKTLAPALWTEREPISVAESRIAQAYVMIGESAKRVQENIRLERERREKDLREVGQALITTFDFKELEVVIKTHLERLGIPSAFVSLFRTVDNQEAGSTVFLDYAEGSGGEAAASVKEHTAHALPPSTFFPARRRYAYSVHPLCFKHLRFGYIMFEVGPETGLVYDTLQVQIASALMGSESLREQTRIKSKLEKKTDTIQELVRPMIASIGGVMEAIKEKLGALSDLVNLTKENSVKLKSTNSSIEHIGKRIYSMSGILNIIESVSSSVHILAINTSIEATHAGVLGAGFSVIASELRKLADSIRSNTGAVSELIMGIRPDMEITEKAGNASLEAFLHLEQDVLKLADTMQHIIQAMEGLSSNSSQIMAVMNE
jgi:DNA-binding LacI/PurR family transcriptional regulator